MCKLPTLFVATLLLLPFNPLWSAPLKTGFAERDISPEIGMERPGGYGKSFHKSFHDPCKARAVVFDDGEKAVAMVGLDALFIRRPQVLEVRKRVHEKTGIAPEAVLIGASHSHSSGPTGMVLPGEFDDAPELIQELAYEQSSTADPKYLELMVDGIVGAIVSAYEKRQELPVGFGRGEEGSVSFNRRWRMKNGLTFTHPRYGNPDAEKPAGPIDPEVGVIGGWSADGKLLGCVVNWACHATTSPRGISANYPWALEKVIRGTFGDHVVVVFLNGNSGDVTQVDNAFPYRRPSGELDALRVGGSVGAECVKVLVHQQARTTDLPVDFRNEVLKIERRHPSKERLAKCREIVREKPTEAQALNDWIWAKEIVMLQASIDKEPIRDVEVQAIQIGPAVFISNPAEYFTEFGLQQKAASKFPFTFPVSLANGCVGYVPTTEALGPHGGGYETRLTGYSNLVPEAGDQIRDKGIDLANDMKPGQAPELEPVPAVSSLIAGWRYGEKIPRAAGTGIEKTRGRGFHKTGTVFACSDGMLEIALEKFPVRTELVDGTPCSIRPMEVGDEFAFRNFHAVIPDREQLFILNQIKDGSLFEEWMADPESGEHNAFLAFVDARLVAMGYLKQRMGGWKRHIGEVCFLTHPDYHGMGLIDRLLGEIVEVARHCGLTKLESESNGERITAIRAMGAAGFDELVRIPDYVQDMNAQYHDYVLMGMELVASFENLGAGD